VIPLASTISLSQMGSFFVGGHARTTTGAPLAEYVFTPNGVSVSIAGQMYVQYFVPAETVNRVPMAFWHGGSMTGATWETTPDGREGWLTQFLRQGWAVYNSDAVERGRAGWAPNHPPFSGPPILRTAEDTFSQFRIGRRVNQALLDDMKTAAYPSCRFPLQAFDNLMKQVVPRWVSTDDLTLAAYIELLDKIGPVVLVAHSQGGAFAFRAAEARPDKVAAIVAIEPAQGGTEGMHTKLIDTPVLVVYGDHLELDDRWPQIRARTERYLSELSRAGGTVEVIDLPDQGVVGNSHLLMMEDNNTEIAALIQQWLGRYVPVSLQQHAGGDTQ